jgi:hypothetical protein
MQILGTEKEEISKHTRGSFLPFAQLQKHSRFGLAAASRVHFSTKSFEQPALCVYVAAVRRGISIFGL